MQRAKHSRTFRSKKSNILFKNTACNKFPFGLNLSVIWLFDATYGASSFLFNIGYELKTMKVSDLPDAKIYYLFGMTKKYCIYLQSVFEKGKLLLRGQQFYLQSKFHNAKIIHIFETTKLFTNNFKQEERQFLPLPKGEGVSLA